MAPLAGVPDFQLSSKNISVSRTNFPDIPTLKTLMFPYWILWGWGYSGHHGSEVILGRHWWLLNGYYMNRVILDTMGHNYTLFSTCVLIFSPLSQIEVCQEHPVPEVILVRHWWSLTGYYDDGITVICDYWDMCQFLAL